MTAFEVGHTYYTHGTGGPGHIIRITIANRTAHTVITTEGKALRVCEWQGVEHVKPWGNVPRAPIVSADCVESKSPSVAVSSAAVRLVNRTDVDIRLIEPWILKSTRHRHPLPAELGALFALTYRSTDDGVIAILHVAQSGRDDPPT